MRTRSDQSSIKCLFRSFFLLGVSFSFFHAPIVSWSRSVPFETFKLWTDCWKMCLLHHTSSTFSQSYIKQDLRWIFRNSRYSVCLAETMKYLVDFSDCRQEPDLISPQWSFVSTFGREVFIWSFSGCLNRLEEQWWLNDHANRKLSTRRFMQIIKYVRRRLMRSA